MNFKQTVRHTLALFLISAFVFSSCRHSGTSGGGNPVNNSYLASARNYAPGFLTVDSFIYDANHLITRLIQYQVDTPDHRQDTIYTNFTYSGGSSVPTGYTFTFSSGIPDPHQLTFDGQGRITKDTSLNGGGFVTYYTYPGDYIICKILFEGSITDAMIDTLTVSDGDVTEEKVWVGDGSSLTEHLQAAFGHAAAANPGYKDQIANTIGPLLFVLDAYNYSAYGDYISKTVVNKVSSISEGNSATFNYDVNTDVTGRVNSLTPTGAGSPEGTKTVFTYY